LKSGSWLGTGTKMWQPPLTSNHRTQKGQQNMGLEIQVLAWDRH
jgi:hypothetical protein